MNMTEAAQVTTLLRWLLGPAEHPVEQSVTADDACAAAAALADRSYTALHAGFDGHDVRNTWPELPAFRAGALPTLHAALDLPDDESTGRVVPATDIREDYL